MEHLSIDIETYSSEDITKVGLYKYAQSPDFEILLFAYKVDDGDVIVVDLTAGEKIPLDIILALGDEKVIKHAYNAAFEYYCLNQAGYPTPICQWKCTMAHGMYLGYPAGLGAIGAAIGLPEDKQKLTIGKRLISYFCKPCKPTRTNGQRTRNLPTHDPDKWKLFKEYNAQDVVAEYNILQRLNMFPWPDNEIKLWRADVRMNEKGIRVDTDLIAGALAIDQEGRDRLIAEAVNITGLNNPNSTAQLLPWLNDHGCTISNLTKDSVADALAGELTPETRRVLEIRQLLGKTSNKKYETMAAAVGEGDRVRGVSQYYGAMRTGRYAGRMVQMQNLPRTYMSGLEEARALVKMGNYDAVKLIYDNVPDTLSQLIRTAFIPSKGNKFVVADFSAIEARVIAWLAGETWVNEVFATHGKIYEATASQMYGIPFDSIVKGNPNYSYRAKGKVATLALGYGGGPNALIAMGALRDGIPEEELPELRDKWRQANPHIVDMWYRLERAAVEALESGEPREARGIMFQAESDIIFGQRFLTIKLPSGRKLYYNRPHLAPNRFDGQSIHFYGQETGKWKVLDTYSGKLTENIVQAIARDCLTTIMQRIWAEGYDIVFHVHDEVIVDAPEYLTVEHLCKLMAQPIEWAPGLILKGAGFEGQFYKKD